MTTDDQDIDFTLFDLQNWLKALCEAKANNNFDNSKT